MGSIPLYSACLKTHMGTLLAMDLLKVLERGCAGKLQYLPASFRDANGQVGEKPL
jgi:hypothetical protein